MAALAYVFPPLSGLVAYLNGVEARTRFHGLQGVFLGLAWPGAMYLCSLLTPGATQIAFLTGAAVWAFVMLGTAVGRNPRLPVVGRAFESWAGGSPGGAR